MIVSRLYGLLFAILELRRLLNIPDELLGILPGNVAALVVVVSMFSSITLLILSRFDFDG